MQVVIDIPEKTYYRIQALVSSDYFEHDICGDSMQRIANGTPLPKGHGRLIDEEQIPGDGGWDFSDRLMSTPTIIEADTGKRG